jgi:hypothetical protein
MSAVRCDGFNGNDASAALGGALAAVARLLINLQHIVQKTLKHHLALSSRAEEI